MKHNYPTSDDIYLKICKLYNTNPLFIKHIIRSCFPICKITRVDNFIKQCLSNRRCSLSDIQISDLYTISSIISSNTNMHHDYVYQLISDKKTRIQQIEKDSGKKVAMIGCKSDKMICINAYSELLKFIKYKIQNRDKDIYAIICNEFYIIYESEIRKRFDTTIHYRKLDKNVKNEFISFILERNADIVINYERMWERIGNRIKIKQTKKI